MLYELVAWDTDSRSVRHREYTRSKLKAERWEKIPRIQFTDSGHGIVFSSHETSFGRKPAIMGLASYVKKHLG